MNRDIEATLGHEVIGLTAVYRRLYQLGKQAEQEERDTEQENLEPAGDKKDEDTETSD